MLHQIKGGFAEKSQQSLQIEQSQQQPEAFELPLKHIPNITIQY